MANRLLRRRQAITAAGCVFCCAALLLVSGAQGAIVACQIIGSGDRIVASSDWTWAAGTGNLQTIPPLSCGDEYLSGGYSQDLISRGGTFASQQKVDNTEIMVFTQASQLTGGSGQISESMMVFEAGSIYDSAVCEPIPDDELIQASAYNQMAQVSSLVMGSSLDYQSQGAIVQADDTVPDSMASQILVSGDGMAQLSASSFNQVGIGNTTALGYEQRMNDRIKAGGDEFKAGLIFEWSSFADMWQGEEVEA